MYKPNISDNIKGVKMSCKTIIDNPVVFDRNLKGNEIKILLVIFAYKNMIYKPKFSVRWLSDQTGLSYVTVQKAMGSLIDKEILIELKKTKTGRQIVLSNDVLNYIETDIETISKNEDEDNPTDIETISIEKPTDIETISKNSKTDIETISIRNKKEISNMNKGKNNKNKKKTKAVKKISDCEKFVEYYNKLYTRKFKPKSDDTNQLYKARIAEGWTHEEIKTAARGHESYYQSSCIDGEYSKEWLNPMTLLRKSKIEKYYNSGVRLDELKALVEISDDTALEADELFNQILRNANSERDNNV